MDQFFDVDKVNEILENIRNDGPSELGELNDKFNQIKSAIMNNSDVNFLEKNEDGDILMK